MPIPDTARILVQFSLFLFFSRTVISKEKGRHFFMNLTNYLYTNSNFISSFNYCSYMNLTLSDQHEKTFLKSPQSNPQTHFVYTKTLIESLKSHFITKECSKENFLMALKGDIF